MKINIFHYSKKGLWGGGNQFLNALKKELVAKGLLSKNTKDSDATIFNGYQELWPLLIHRFSFKKSKIIYRLGPVMSLHRKAFKWKVVDYLMVWTANLFSDLIIFQSNWSYLQAVKLGLWKNKKYSIILNAVDSSIFYPKEFKEKTSSEKIKLIYTSWSSNIKKGFNYLKFLDDNLDFNKYEMTFIGNTPFDFRNIKVLKPLESYELAGHLRNSDIFVSPVEDDACSNALIEGLSCGLPAVVLKSGGNEEIIGISAGETFSNNSELLEKIDKVASNLRLYSEGIKVKNIEEIANEYVSAIESLC